MTTLSYFHRGGAQPLLGSTIDEHFRSIVARFPEREAVVSVPQGRRLTYQELDQQVDAVARGLVARGVGKGDRVGIWSSNNVEWLLIQLATARIGSVLVNINPAYRARELGFALKRSDVQLLFTVPGTHGSDNLKELFEVAPELASAKSTALQCDALPHLKRVVLYHPEDLTRAAPAACITAWTDLLEAGQRVSSTDMEALPGSLDRDDAINIQFTSGTTGFPKPVVLSHHNILNNAYFTALAMQIDETDRLCVPVPFYHCFGMVLANLLCLSVGACLVIPAERFEAGSVLEAVERERCTALHGVPTMFIAELEEPHFAERDLTSLRTGIMAGAPCPPPLMKRVMEDLHCPQILIGYGQTEASPLTHLTTPDDTLERRTTTVGRNLPHQEVKIVDVTSGGTVPLGVTGELCFRGYHIMKGYYEDAEATSKAIDDNGWLHSGDLGCMDAEGYVQITGRLKDMIIRGGENIYPREIEDVLFEHEKVANVAVFGVPDDYYGEQVMAWVKLHEGATMTEQEAQDYCRQRLAHFKVPKHIWFVDEFPMTVTGKLQKFRMRELALERMT